MEIALISKKQRQYFESMMIEPDRAEEEHVFYLGVAEDNRPCGAAAVGVDLNEMTIHSIYIDPAYRRRGYGRALIDSILQIADKLCIPFVATDFMFSFEGIGELLLDRGFMLVSDTPLYSVDVADLNVNGIRKKMLAGDNKKNTRSVNDMDQKERTGFKKGLKEDGYPVLRLKSGDFRKDLSFGVFDSEKAFQGAVIVFDVDKEEGSVIIEYLCNRGNMKSAVMKLFGSLIERIIEDESINSICFQPVNQKVLEIARMFAGYNIREADHSFHAVYDI